MNISSPDTKNTALLETLMALLKKHWAGIFARPESDQHALKFAVGFLCSMGRRTITRVLGFHGEEQCPWSGSYKFFSQSPWEAQQLFSGIVPQLIESGDLSGPYICVATDDTGVRRTGKKIKSAQWMRDTMSPPFHVNLMWGQRYLQSSVLVPHYEKDQESSPRAVPIRFKEVPAVKKPGKGAGAETMANYKEEKKKRRLSLAGIEQMEKMREEFDRQGLKDKTIIHTTDASYMNRTTLSKDLERAVLLGRVRKDARLCYRAREGGRRYYAKEKFTPEEVAKDEGIGWKEARIFHGGRYRKVEYKELHEVLWEGAGRRKLLRLLVIRPVAYRTTKNGKKHYRQRSYLLCTDAKIPAEVLLQAYFDRWQIEYNHRDEKDVLGIGEAQVWAEESVPRVPTFIVASYAWLLVSAMETYPPKREEGDYLPLPRWRKPAKRASCRDMINALRREVYEERVKVGQKLKTEACAESMCLTAAA